MLNFSGLVYSGGDEEAGRLKVEAKCAKLGAGDIKEVMDLLEVDRSSKTGGVTKDALVDRLVETPPPPLKTCI